MSRTITAYFDSRTEAMDAVERLTAAGIPRSDINVVATDETTTTNTTYEHKGFFESLGDFFMPDEDRSAYEEGIRRGGSVLTVKATDERFEHVSDILEEAGSVDLDTRETQWRADGWSGYDASTAATTTSGYDRTSSVASSDVVAGRSLATGMTAGEADYIPVAEEKLRVGKREVDHGRVRIRSYVVETPVEASVSLREENVSLERNTVDRAATAADNLFQDRTIEATTISEEAVISKEARVVEEVRLNKDVNVRDETVRDTVRRTEVEVDDERAGTSRIAAGTSFGRVLTEEERLAARRDV